MKKTEEQTRWDEEVYKLNFTGSYHDPKRATEAIKELEEQISERRNPQDANQVLVIKDLAKEKMPRITRTKEQMKDFEIAMKAKFGAMTEVIQDKIDDEDFDEIKIT